MLSGKPKFLSIIIILFVVIPIITSAQARKINYRFINLKKISRYHEDRIIFQHVELDHVKYKPSASDNSMATLLIIKKKKMYLFKDGYDNPIEVASKKSAMEMENKLVDDIWFNKIDSIPDFMQVTDRRVVLMQVTDRPGNKKDKNKKKESFLKKNYQNMYIKVRDTFIDRHVKIFRLLMINRKESKLFVKRSLIPKKMYETAEKYKVSVTAKTINGAVYYAEDADGDGVTETFYVKITDGFHWGFKSGPNVIFIYNNKRDDIKKKIGNLAFEAYYGTKEEKDNIKNTFPKTETLTDMVDYLYQIDKDLQAKDKKNK